MSAEELGKELELKLFEIASKNKEIKNLKEELAKLKEPDGLKKLEEQSNKLKELTKKDQKEINDLLNELFELQGTVSKQTEDIRLLKEENERLKKNDDLSIRKEQVESGSIVDEEPPEGEDTFEIMFRYNIENFSRRFYGDNTIGQVKAFVRKKLGLNKVTLFSTFPRKNYDNDRIKIKDTGIAKREMLNVGT